MTGYNRMNQRLAIKKPYERPKGTKPGEYVPRPKCGTLMANTKRANAHCKEYD